ncbi:hypothetical protein EPO15_06195 [bacterium]|nr:MAG: hypothetical protein EPO15_06195 [bacterium]
MSDAPPIDAAPIDEALGGLSELAACDLRLAKRFCARIEACGDEDDGKAMDLARSYQRMARSYRQTLVVQARLRRELKAEAKADEVEAKAARQARTYNLKAAIRAEIRPRIWTMEREEERCDALDSLLDDLIGDAAARLDFLDRAPEAHVAAILADLDLDADAQDDEAAAQTPDDDEVEDEDEVPDATDPPGTTRAAAPPADDHASAGDAETASPDPDPPPRPPDPPPEPYIPPWERLRPGQTFPGGSGW